MDSTKQDASFNFKKNQRRKSLEPFCIREVNHDMGWCWKCLRVEFWNGLSRWLSGHGILRSALLAAATFSGQSGLAATSDDPTQGDDSVMVEWSEYRLRWGIFAVGSVRMELWDGVDGDHGKVEMRLWARTNSWMDRFLKARTEIRCRYDVEAERSLHYQRIERDGVNPEVNETLFDWERGEAKFSKNGDERVPLQIGERAEDPLSIVHAVRRRQPVAGQVYSIPVTDGKALATARIEIRDGGRVRTPAGRFETLEAIADLGDVRGVFARPDGALIRVWVTKDPPHLPVQLQSRIALGRFTAELTDFAVVEPVSEDP